MEKHQNQFGQITEMDFPHIDPRSFHAFQVDDEQLLFDRATAATLKVEGSESFGILLDIEARNLSHTERSAQTEAIQVALREMHARGMFRYESVDKDEQDRLLRQLLRHKPRRIQLLMAQGCNLGCRYCYAWRNGSNQKGTLMSWEVAKASVDYLVRRSANRKDIQVTFFGGEPLLNYEMVRRLVHYCRNLESFTNTGIP